MPVKISYDNSPELTPPTPLVEQKLRKIGSLLLVPDVYPVIDFTRSDILHGRLKTSPKNWQIAFEIFKRLGALEQADKPSAELSFGLLEPSLEPYMQKNWQEIETATAGSSLANAISQMKEEVRDYHGPAFDALIENASRYMTFVALHYSNSEQVTVQDAVA